MISAPTSSFWRLGWCLFQKWHSVPAEMGVGSADHNTARATPYTGFRGSECWDYN